ncbi:unnamed protein product, partial [Mesorhabditis spiculigera]
MGGWMSKEIVETPKQQQMGPYTFDQLVKDLHTELRGDRDEHGNVKNEEKMLKIGRRLLERYMSQEGGWRKYAFGDPKKIKYYRNMVAQGKGWYLLVLVWPEGLQSAIHGHSNANCFVKMLDGELLERRYDTPESLVFEGKPEANGDSAKVMRLIGENRYTKNNVSYMSDDQGLHSMNNDSNSNEAISLHLYFPAFTQCLCFDEETSFVHEGTMVWHTVGGVKTEHFGN